MNDRTLSFTGLTVKASQVISSFNPRKVSAPFPPEWVRVEVPLADGMYGVDVISKMDDYLADNFDCRWGVYKNESASKLILFFEDDSDAVMFKLQGGPEAYLETSTEE